MCSFLPCLSWLLRSRVRKSRRDLWITLYIISGKNRRITNFLNPPVQTSDIAWQFSLITQIFTGDKIFFKSVCFASLSWGDSSVVFEFLELESGLQSCAVHFFYHSRETGNSRTVLKSSGTHLFVTTSHSRLFKHACLYCSWLKLKAIDTVGWASER